MKFCRIAKYELSRQLKWVYIQVQGDGFLTYRGRCFAYDKVASGEGDTLPPQFQLEIRELK
ncbi:hypothetical protein P5673_001218 [Acropora cervicornis]|uniref:Uncharacterized protein n=1 Tax=Acropora cervicornis TaxID=6130 RepID=A0AAD9R5Q7_ACRCE|nr:hypothetical protein P5673_001218 [Acropora cervicornis]